MSARPTSSGSGNGLPSYVLEFEKPIAKIEQEIHHLEVSQAESGRDYSDVIKSMRQDLQRLLREAYAKLTPWEKVLVARHPKRPLFRDYLRMIAKDFCELHGDKLYGDDRSIICGFARVAGRKVLLIGHHKGRDTREKIESNFGCAHPEGYRKALQKMKLAEKFGLPVVCLIDTPGAYPGVESEERGIARAIAMNLMELSRLETPVIACVIGEGGSGGALGLAVADHVAVMEHAYYSVISPEGCAAILWKDGEYTPRAAEGLKLTPTELSKLELIDSVVPEPLGGAHRDPAAAAAAVESWIGKSLDDLKKLKTDALLKRRYERLRKVGTFFVDLDRETKAVAPARTTRARKSTVARPTTPAQV